MMAIEPSVSHEKRLVEELRADPQFARTYLKVALEEEWEAVIQIALRRLALAYGMANLAKEAGMSRETLYRALSPRGNPTLRTIEAMAGVLGAKVTLEWKEDSARTKKRRRNKDSWPALAA
ncbi:MAG: addiction module antidote protein [Burkholderiales bacterium]